MRELVLAARFFNMCELSLAVSLDALPRLYGLQVCWLYNGYELMTFFTNIIFLMHIYKFSL